jgi:hypothetical protein
MIILIDDNKCCLEFEMDDDYPGLMFITWMFGDLGYLWSDDDEYVLNIFKKDTIIGIDDV